jgi:nitrile hydratase accessory protein
VTTSLLDVDGPAAPPRSNGELVFAEPWESRAFGLAMTLHDRGAFEWETFRLQLIAAVGEWERGHPDDECWSYYRCWLTALQRVLASEGVVAPDQIVERAHQLARRPTGHDHGVQATEAGHEH